jgi:hypothetical protein
MSEVKKGGPMSRPTKARVFPVRVGEVDPNGSPEQLKPIEQALRECGLEVAENGSYIDQERQMGVITVRLAGPSGDALKTLTNVHQHPALRGRVRIPDLENCGTVKVELVADRIAEKRVLRVAEMLRENGALSKLNPYLLLVG